VSGGAGAGMRRLEGKVAIVTGAGKGIGRGIARRFAREGASVVVAEMDDDAGRRVASELEALGGRGSFIHSNVSKKSDVQAAVSATLERFGRIDVLVNNAITVSPNVLLEEKRDEHLEATLAVGLWAVWWGMHAVFPTMRAQRGGRIINFHSIDADAGAWFHADYNATKGAVAALTRSAAAEWARFNILVNAVAPIAASHYYEGMVEQNPGLAEAVRHMIPLGRIGDVEDDIAPTVAFLASDDSKFVTGSILPVDGGLHMPRMNTKPPGISGG